MGRADLQGEYIGPDGWAFTAAEVLGGVDTGTSFWGSDLIDIPKRNFEVVVDGIVLVIANANAQVYNLQVDTTIDVPSVLMHGSTAATGGAYEVLTPIGVPVQIRDSNFVKVAMTTAALDVITITVWGHWQDPRTLPAAPTTKPQPVTVEDIRWPWERG